MKETVILNDKELGILLAAAGISGFCGFRQGQGSDGDEVPYLIHAMVRNAVIRQEGGELIVREPYSAMINSLKNARAVLSVETGEDRKKVMYIYIGTGFLSMADSLNDKNAVRLKFLEKEEVMDLLDRHFCPEGYQGYPKELIAEEPQGGSGRCSAAVSLTVFERGRAGARVSEWLLYEGKYECSVKFIRGDRVTYCDYRDWSNLRIMESVKEMIRGGSYDTDGCICT